MAISTLYEIDMGDQRIDVSAATRKFQTSIIVKQDPEKNGILSFLTTVEQETSNQPNQTGSSNHEAFEVEAGGSSSGGYS